MNLKSKKAIILPEVLRIILSVLAILILIYLAVSLYGLFTRKTELEQARASLEAIESRFVQIEETGTMKEILITNPVDWRIVSFYDKKRLCICPEADNIDQASVCDKEGICINTKIPIKVESKCYKGIFTLDITENCLLLKRDILPINLILHNLGELYELKTDKEVIAETILDKINNSIDVKIAIIDFYAYPNDDKETALRTEINKLFLEDKSDWELKIKRTDLEKTESLKSKEEGVYTHYYFSEVSAEQTSSFKSTASRNYEISFKVGKLEMEDEPLGA